MVFAPLGEVFADALASAAESYVTSRPVLGTIIRAGTAEGLSGNAILSAMRGAGLTVGNDAFWAVRGQVLASANRFADAAALAAGDPGAVVEIAGGHAGSYRVEFRAYYQRTEEDGTVENGYQQFTLHQRELDIDSAREDATSIWGNNSDTQSFPGTLLGLEITGIYQYTGT